jgi:hypothetical protein
MAFFYTRNTAVLLRSETTPGVDSVPTGAANAMLVSDVSIEPNIETIDRALIRPFLGGSEQLSGNTSIQVRMTVELAGSGTAGTAPAWGPALRACGYAEVVTAGQRVEYTPVSLNHESCTIYAYIGGTLHIVLGARGTAVFQMGIGERPTIQFTFTGFDGGMTAAALPSTTLTAFRTPVAITDPNAGDINLGCTYAAGALSGGTVYKSRGLSLDLGNDVQYIPTLGGDSVDIVARAVTGEFSLDLSAANRVALYNQVRANTLSSLGFSFGTTAGHRLLLHSPSAQLTTPRNDDVNGGLFNGYQLRLVPSPAGSGNDELRLVVS